MDSSFKVVGVEAVPSPRTFNSIEWIPELKKLEEKARELKILSIPLNGFYILGVFNLWLLEAGLSIPLNGFQKST